MSGRVCPWSSWLEWKAVRDGLLGDDVGAAAAAVDRVIAWRQRGRIPLAVDITSALVYTFLRDPIAPRAHLRSHQQVLIAASESTLQSEYALTIIRFVNGVTDSVQKGKVAASVSRHAEFAGLHPLLVDVRHQSTHNSLASLHSLRLAAAHALSWLQQNYWDAQASSTAECYSDAAGLVLKLVENQAARLSLSTRHMSNYSSDSDSEDTAEIHAGLPVCEDAPNAAALKRIQRSLLKDLKQVVPVSQPSILAACIISCEVAELQESCVAFRGVSASPHGKQKSPASKKRKASSLVENSSQSKPAVVSTLTLLDALWSGAVRNLVIECTSALCEVKRFLLRTTAVEHHIQPPRSTPPSARTSIAWLSAALEACQGSRELGRAQQVVQYALQHLFSRCLLFTGSSSQSNSLQPEQDASELAPVAAFYSSCCSQQMHEAELCTGGKQGVLCKADLSCHILSD
jgi:hypothetical protein